MLAQRLRHINEYYFSQKMREIEDLNRVGMEVINLGIGSPDLPPHPEVIKTLQQTAADPGNHAYQSYKGSAVLRNAIAVWYKQFYGVTVDPDSEILPLIGSKEGIMHICMTYLEQGDYALLPDPGYPTYGAAVTLAGARSVKYDLMESNGWLPDLPAIELRIAELVSGGQRAPKLMFLNYPHMPSGTRASPGLFKELIAFAKRNKLLLIHDNPYSFILNDQPTSLMAVPGAFEVALELNSLSKSHNMAGWRVGMLIGAAERLSEVLRFKSNMDSGMFLPVQLAAATALGLGKSWYDALNHTYKNRQHLAFELLESLGCTYDRHQAGMFIWANVPPAFKDGFDLSDRLLSRAAVFITPGGIFGNNGSGYIRISLCSSEDKINEAITRIKHTL